MRLLGDPAKHAAVEIFDGYSWVSICTTGWNIDAAGIVCRHFGYITALGALQIPVETELVRLKMMQVECFPHMAVYGSLFYCNTKTTVECLCGKDRAGVVCSKG